MLDDDARREVVDLVRAAIDELIEHLDRRRGGGARMTTGVMVTTTTVILDDDTSGTAVATIGTAAAAARVLCYVSPPTAVYVVRTL